MQSTHHLRIGKTEYGAAEFYIVDESSKTVWDLVDGVRTIKDIVRDALGSGKFQKPEDVYGTLLFFAQSGALKSAEEPSTWRRVKLASSFMTQIALIRDSTRILAAVHKAVRPLLRTSLFWASMVIAFIGVIVYAPRFNSAFNDRTTFQVLGSTVVGFLFYNFVVLAPVIVIHEMAHGLALLHYSGRSGEVGTGWFYFGPTFYVDVTSYWNLPRSQRIMIMWAGNLSTVLIGSFLVLSELFFNYSAPVMKGIDIAAFWCFYGTLWNLNPAFETDGYYMLADIIKMPNLRQEGFSYLKTRIMRLIQKPFQDPEGLTQKKRIILLGYTVLSIAALTYIGFQALRFAAYMGLDATSWALRLSSTVTAVGLSPLEVAVGITAITYFGLTVSGYSVLIGNQVKKSLVHGLKFDAIHDRNLAVFFYLSPQIPLNLKRKFEKTVRKLAKHLTINSSIHSAGPLLFANIKVGRGVVPLSELKLHLRDVENRFYRAYLTLVVSACRGPKSLTNLWTGSLSVTGLLWKIARMVPVGQRTETGQVLREYLQRRARNVRYLFNSTFSTVWTVEVPPAEQQELLQDLLPRMLVEDLTMTNLAEETEEFKKHIIYGLDTIAEFASSIPEKMTEILAQSEKYQLVPLFEPVRGRIIFVGRTEGIERDLDQFGKLFIVQVWSGHVDNLLTDTNLTLYSVVQALPPIPEDLSTFRDGEVHSIQSLASSLVLLQPNVDACLSRIHEGIGPCRDRLTELKTLVQLAGMFRTGLLQSILALNMENMRSIPVRLKDTVKLSKSGFTWVNGLSTRFSVESENRRTQSAEKRKKSFQTYLFTLLLSTVLTTSGLFQQDQTLRVVFLGGAILLQAAFLSRFYLLWRSVHIVSRHPSASFLGLLPIIYGLTMAFDNLVVQGEAVSPANIAAKQEKEGS